MSHGSQRGLCWAGPHQITNAISPCTACRYVMHPNPCVDPFITADREARGAVDVGGISGLLPPCLSEPSLDD